MFINILLVIAGFFILIKGSDYLVKGSSAIAKRFGISTLVIGLTVVAFGTSAPEFFVNVVAALHGSTEIAIGNVLGSNLANILLVLGAVALIRPIKLKSNTIWKEIPLSFLAIIMVFVFGSDVWLNGAAQNVISRTDGIALFAFLILFLVYTFGLRRDTDLTDGMETESVKLSFSIFYVISGLVALAIGGKFVVDGASFVALALGVSQHLIAITVVAIGTSLPELVSSVVAVKKGHTDLAIGNVIGSNILNIFFVLSASAIIHPLPFDVSHLTDVFIVATVTAILLGVLLVGKRHVIERWAGILFLFMYFGFITFAIVRG